MTRSPTMTLPLAAALCREGAQRSEEAAVLLDNPDATRQALLLAFRALEEAGERRDVAQQTIIDVMREQGLTWAEIGTLLGTTRQAAWQRFGGSGAHG